MSIKCLLFSIIIRAWIVTGIQVPSTDSIFFRVYNGYKVSQYVDVPVNQSRILLRFLNPRKVTALYVHGFDESVESNSVKLIANAHLRNGNYNIVAVDYRILAANNYVLAVFSASRVGIRLASALNELIYNGWKANKLHVIGHSLGAHVCGFLGRNVAFKVPRITGLDPAGPLFNFLNPRLTAADAQFVDIIHTDIKFYGIFAPTGHVDFFPNGGTRIQPGCAPNPIFYSDLGQQIENFSAMIADFCSHHFSYTVYAESLIRNEFVAAQCESFAKFKSGQCNNNRKVHMGYSTPPTARGVYFLSTSQRAPYGLGIRGARN